ncbi:MAG: argininosuccinate lyase, partial [Methanothrix sp.]
ATGGRPDLADLDRMALEMAGYKVSERGFAPSDLKRALDTKSNVALRSNTGGPAPEETERMIKKRLKIIALAEERLEQRRESASRALAELKNLRPS